MPKHEATEIQLGKIFSQMTLTFVRSLEHSNDQSIFFNFAKHDSNQTFYDSYYRYHHDTIILGYAQFDESLSLIKDFGDIKAPPFGNDPRSFQCKNRTYLAVNGLGFVDITNIHSSNHTKGLFFINYSKLHFNKMKFLMLHNICATITCT